MNKGNCVSNPLTLFLPAELRNILEAGWQIMGFHKDASGYDVHLIRGTSEQVWHFDMQKGYHAEQEVPPKKDYVFS